jgi:subtilisin family serine protease
MKRFWLSAILVLGAVQVNVQGVREDAFFTLSSSRLNRFLATTRSTATASAAAPGACSSGSDGSEGSNVRVYVVDSGILPTHSEFENRVDTAPSLTRVLNRLRLGLGAHCWDSTRGSAEFTASASHGTAVASLIGGKTLGVASKVTLVDVRAFGCDGSASVARIAEALDWIPTDPNRGTGPRVVNLSFSALTRSTDPTGSINAAINRLVDKHKITVVAAAGNATALASSYTPAGASRAITTGGLGRNNTRWRYSNHGGSVNLYAPAQFVEAASTKTRQFFPSLARDQYRSELEDCASHYAQDTCTSGTSFSAPFATGAIARHLEKYPRATPSQVLSYLRWRAAAPGGGTVTEPSGRAVPILNVGACG